MTDQIRVRRMRAEDLPSVITIEATAYTVPWSEATFRGLLQRADADLVVAELDGALVGYACSWFVVDQGELGNVAVAEGWRNHGVGTRLIESVIERALERGAREVFLEVRPSNISAQRLYGRFGFREVARRRNYYTDPPEDAVVMRRSLQPAKR